MTAGGNSFKSATAHKVNSYYTLAIFPTAHFVSETHYFRPCLPQLSVEYLLTTPSMSIHSSYEPVSCSGFTNAVLTIDVKNVLTFFCHVFLRFLSFFIFCQRLLKCYFNFFCVTHIAVTCKTEHGNSRLSYHIIILKIC